MKAWWLLWSVWLSIVATRAHSAKPEAQTASGLYDLVEPSIAEPADDEQALAPLLLVSTVDGQLHGLKRNSGQWLWSLHSENASFTPQPLVQSSTLAQQSTSADGETYILEPVSGGHIYIHQRHQDSTTKLPLTLAELVDMSPFVFPSQHATSTTADRMFVGSRTTSLIGLDLSTGRLVGEFGQGNGWCEWRAPGLAEAPEDEIRRRPQDLLYVGRTEYNLSILSKSSGSLIQSLAFTSYHPSSSLRHTDSPSRSPADQRYFQPTHDGTLVCFQSGAGMAWASQPFGADESNPIINIFDIAIDHAANAPVLHAHPSLLHAPGVPRALSELQKLPDAAYVGLLKDNATPFAMSRSHFPLIDPVRRSPTSVQDEPEACQGAQCLVGLRKLEEPAWHRSAVMPAPSRLAIDDNPHVEEHPSTLPSPESLLTLPPAPPHHYATSTIKLTSLLVVLATCVVLLLRQKYLNRRLFAPAPVQAKQHQQPRVRLQEPEVSPDLKEKALPPLPQSTETAPDEDDYSGEGTPGATSKRSKRRGKRGKRAGQKVAALNNANDAPNATIGSLCVSDEILGYGSHGTVVLQGTFQGRAVAVKRLLSHLTTLASHEVTLLQESDEHPNVIRYFAKEQHQNFLYIALERCPANLADLIETPDKCPQLLPVFEPKQAMAQITSGLSHLHTLKIVHRDMKPQNILISPKQTVKGLKLRMLISDFGLCKKLAVDESSFFQTANHAAGSFGYRAPEVLKGQVNPNDPSMEPTAGSSTSTGTRTSQCDLTAATKEKRRRLGRSLDVFALGCIFYYILTSGEHPFGHRFERELNIVRDHMSLERLDGLGEESHEAQHLIKTMVSAEPSNRPTAEQVSIHPFFWTPHMRLNFLCEASDRFEIMERDPPDPVLVTLERSAEEIVGGDWFKPLDPRLVENLGKYRKYNADSVRDLLRVIRNKKHHYLDLPEPVRRSLGAPPEDFLSYFTHRFPSLLLHVWSVIANSVAHEAQFESNYFKLPLE